MVQCTNHYRSGSSIFFFNDTATTEIYTLSLHDALPIWDLRERAIVRTAADASRRAPAVRDARVRVVDARGAPHGDRKSTRLNSSHANISYAVFCLKKKNWSKACPPSLLQCRR